MEVNDQFRVNHSKLIEQYQLIEFHLEGLFAIMQDNGTNFEELAKRVENDAMGELIRKVKFLSVKLNFENILNKELFNALYKIRDDRNYYCHENYLIDKNDSYKVNRKTTIEQDLNYVTNVNKELKEAFIKIKKFK